MPGVFATEARNGGRERGENKYIIGMRKGHNSEDFFKIEVIENVACINHMWDQWL